MIYELHSNDALLKLWSENPRMCGPSPGGAAAMLGITRQGVYSAIKRGSLDLVRVKEPGWRSPQLYVPDESIDRYRQNQGKPGPRPGVKQQAKMMGDKVIYRTWPK